MSIQGMHTQIHMNDCASDAQARDWDQWDTMGGSIVSLVFLVKTDISYTHLITHASVFLSACAASIRHDGRPSNRLNDRSCNGL